MTFTAEQVRAQFPSLIHPVEGDRLPVFLDNPAGTQVPQSVMDAVTEYYQSMNANAGGYFRTSQRNDAMVQGVRERVADFLNAARPEEIVIGPNMTTLTMSLSRALAKTLSPGDEIVLTRMDHDANVAPWLLIAEDHDLVVKWVDIVESDCTLDMNSLEAALTDKTKIVAAVHASNAVGTINPVEQIAQMAHAAGALFVVDAVQSAPHIPIDVQAIGCDFLLCSAYKFFGPHLGVMWGRYDLLADLPAYKVRPAKDAPPYRWETGTPSFETINALGAAVDYLATIGEQSGTGDFPGFSGRRLHLKQGMDALQRYEQGLAAHLITGLQALPGVTIAGITDSERLHERVPTVAFVKEGYTPDHIAAYLAERHIYLWSGHYYAIEIMDRLGRADEGMVRVGIAHYNTPAEITLLLSALEEMES